MGQRLSKPPREEEFRHALSRNGRYLAKHVEICWKADERGKVSEVRVVFVPREHLMDDAPYARVNARIGPCLQCFGNSMSEAWLTPGGMTPEWVFGSILRLGLADKAALQSAVSEFAKIEECAWAREMLTGFEAPDEHDRGSLTPATTLGARLGVGRTKAEARRALNALPIDTSWARAMRRGFSQRWPERDRSARPAA